jgi:hypothetical protein
VPCKVRPNLVAKQYGPKIELGSAAFPVPAIPYGAPKYSKLKRDKAIGCVRNTKWDPIAADLLGEQVFTSSMSAGSRC